MGTHEISRPLPAFAPATIIPAWPNVKSATSWAPSNRCPPRPLGSPGAAHFRLAAEAGRAQSYIWLEKEQLFQLGLYLQQAVRQLGDSAMGKDSAPQEAPWTGDPLEQDFHARQMQLQYDQDANCFVIHAFEGDEDDPDAGAQTSVSFWMTMTQTSDLADEALRICAAGRPPCFLCGAPIDPDGHRCARANGHAVFETG